MDANGGLKECVARDGFAFLEGHVTRALIEQGRYGALVDWSRFAASWDDLRRDEYMADGVRDRLRRHAVFSIPLGETQPRLEPHQCHYQSREYNALNGGIERWYEPVEPEVAAGATVSSLLSFGAGFFRLLRPGASWPQRGRRDGPRRRVYTATGSIMRWRCLSSARMWRAARRASAPRTVGLWEASLWQNRSTRRSSMTPGCCTELRRSRLSIPSGPAAAMCSSRPSAPFRRGQGPGRGFFYLSAQHVLSYPAPGGTANLAFTGIAC